MDSKVTAIGNKEHSKENIAASIDRSLKALGVESLDIFYLHIPDGQTPFEESMAAVDQQHRNSKFKRLGLSNQSPSQVEQLVEIAEKHGGLPTMLIVRRVAHEYTYTGYIKPSVYQGHYNPVCRKAASSLLPILQKHGISFFPSPRPALEYSPET
jgi:aflatoxin B1 aldehyde reductase